MIFSVNTKEFWGMANSGNIWIREKPEPFFPKSGKRAYGSNRSRNWKSSKTTRTTTGFWNALWQQKPII